MALNVVTVVRIDELQQEAITEQGQQALVDAPEQIGELEDEVRAREPTSWPHVETAHSEGSHHEL